MQSTTESQGLRKTESFWVIEDKPKCDTPYEQRIQEVVIPAMLVSSANGQTFLLYQTDSTTAQPATRGVTPSGDQPLPGYPK
jgi:hypothetical protein